MLIALLVTSAVLAGDQDIIMTKPKPIGTSAPVEASPSDEPISSKPSVISTTPKDPPPEAADAGVADAGVPANAPTPAPANTAVTPVPTAPTPAPANATAKTPAATPSETVTKPGEPAKDVNLANKKEWKKSSVGFVVLGEFVIGTAVTYGLTLLGILANVGLGGAQLPPDIKDITLLGLIPLAGTTASTWLIGLFDIQQRNFFGSLASAAGGSIVGELVGLGIGYAIGGNVAPKDVNGALSIAVLIAPIFAVIGSVIAMEIFKPGEEVEVTPEGEPAPEVTGILVPQKHSDGSWSLAPGIGVRF